MKKRELILPGWLREIFKGAVITTRSGKTYRIFTIDKYRESFSKALLFDSPGTDVKYTEQIIVLKETTYPVWDKFQTRS